MVFNSEKDLVMAFVPYYEDLGFTYRLEVPLHNRIVDLAALDEEGNLVGVEFKLSDWKRALNQALTNKLSFNYIYVCVPKKRFIERLRAEAESVGVGIMVVDPTTGVICVELNAKRIEKQWPPNHKLLRSYLRKGTHDHEKT